MFAHSEAELQNPPSLLKTSLCQAWLDGQCPLEASCCQYAHGRDELRRTPAFQRKKGKNASPAAEVDNVSSDGTSSTPSEVPSGVLSPAVDERRPKVKGQHGVQSRNWDDITTQEGFESEDEFERDYACAWSSEASVHSDVPHGLQQKLSTQQEPHAVPATQAVNCFTMSSVVPMQKAPVQMPPWPVNVAFVPVVMMPSDGSVSSPVARGTMSV